MGRRPLTGPATTHIAAPLAEAQRRNQWSLDDLAERTGLSRSTIDRALKGASTLAVETLIPLCAGMGLDPAVLIREAQAVTGAAHE